jgi:phage terminase Nu1 subunit (DNA packaging protein)
MAICLTKKELANAAGYSYRRLYDIDRNLPADAKLFVPGENGKYDLAAFVQRWVDYNVSSERGTNQSLEEVKAVHELVKTRKTELEVARMEGRLVDVQDVRRLWADIANAVMQNMIRLPSKLAPVLTMMESVPAISAILDREIREALIQIAETPLPEYAMTETEEPENEDEENIEETGG